MKWIDVKDKLPELVNKGDDVGMYSDIVLGYFGKGIIESVELNERFEDKGNIYWSFARDGIITEEVTHWMSKPIEDPK